MAFTMTLECSECGNVVNSKNWQDCTGSKSKRHAGVGMYQVLNWGKYKNPLLFEGIENKGIAEEKKVKSIIAEEINEKVPEGTLGLKNA